MGNVLIGTPPPENAVGGRIAYKTGTSYGYRDAWSLGFDGRRTVGIWVGRADGAPVSGLVGRVAAAPILFDAFARMKEPVAPLPRAPAGTSMKAAIAQAAHDTLVALFASQTPSFDARLEEDLGGIRDTVARGNGIDLGHRAASSGGSTRNPRRSASCSPPTTWTRRRCSRSSSR